VCEQLEAILLRRRGREGERKGRGEGNRKGKGGTPPFTNSWIRPSLIPAKG